MEIKRAQKLKKKKLKIFADIFYLSLLLANENTIQRVEKIWESFKDFAGFKEKENDKQFVSETICFLEIKEIKSWLLSHLKTCKIQEKKKNQKENETIKRNRKVLETKKDQNSETLKSLILSIEKSFF